MRERAMHRSRADQHAANFIRGVELDPGEIGVCGGRIVGVKTHHARGERRDEQRRGSSEAGHSLCPSRYDRAPTAREAGNGQKVVALKFIIRAACDTRQKVRLATPRCGSHVPSPTPRRRKRRAMPDHHRLVAIAAPRKKQDRRRMGCGRERSLWPCRRVRKQRPATTYLSRPERRRSIRRGSYSRAMLPVPLMNVFPCAYPRQGTTPQILE